MAGKFKPSRTAEKHKGYYGNEPVKAAEGTGGTHMAKAGMKPAIRMPCRECPLRRDSAPGFLGGYTPEMYIEVLHSAASIACHESEGFHTQELDKQRHCTGVAAYRANVGHIASTVYQHPRLGAVVVPTAAHRSTQVIGHDDEHYFASPEEFVTHHAPGQKKP